MRTPEPARTAIAVRIPGPATPEPFVFPARRNGHAMTAIMRRTSLTWITHNPDGYPITLRIPLALTSPAGPSIPEIRDTSKPARPRPGSPGPGLDHSCLLYTSDAADE